MINPYKRIKDQEVELKDLIIEKGLLQNKIDVLELEVNELKGLPETSLHPKYKKLIEKVAEIKGRQLYKFKSLLDMPHNRYNKCTRFSTELNMRMDAKDSLAIDEEIVAMINMDGPIKKAKLGNLVGNRIARTELLIGIDASYRLASSVYFWKDEDLDDYDFAIGDEKIKMFKEIGFKSFFLSKPMNNFIPQMSLSAEDLLHYSQFESELERLLSLQLKGKNEKQDKTTT